MGKLEQIALVEQIGLQHAVSGKTADGAGLQRGDPVDTGHEPDRLDGLLRDHAAVPDDHQFVDGKDSLHPLDLGDEGDRVCGVAVMNRDRHRTATGVGDNPIVDLKRS